MTAAELAARLTEPGRAAIPFIDAVGNQDRPLTLHTYRSNRTMPESPVVLVQHGMGRNGDEYRDFWIPAADRHGLLIVATTFSKEHYPEADGYNNGLLLGPDGKGPLSQRDSWGYATLPRIIRLLREGGVTRRPRVHLFGHSAGAQFLHRLLSTQPHDLFEAMSIGNAGWYSLPTLELPFPEGLGGIGLEEAEVVRLLAFPLMILAGDRDIETVAANLPSGEAAKRQGPHRFARAHNYLTAGRKEAARRGVPCLWTLQTVPGIGHDGRAMSAVAASLWFEGKMPETYELAEIAGESVA